ncbi:hypothetical protein RUND412_011264, partial [Rhizina undulata]
MSPLNVKTSTSPPLIPPALPILLPGPEGNQSPEKASLQAQNQKDSKGGRKEKAEKATRRTTRQSKLVFAR